METREGVDRAGRWEGPSAPTDEGARAPRPLSILDLILTLPLILVASLAGAIAWALLVFAVIGLFL